jgi:hypothetical protein
MTVASFFRVLGAISLFGIFTLVVGSSHADGPKQPTRSGKIEIDLDKLPPELARQVIANLEGPRQKGCSGKG